MAKSLQRGKSLIFMGLLLFLGMQSLQAQKVDIKVCPNPAKEKFHLCGLNGEARVIMYDRDGRVLIHKFVRDDETIELSNFQKGIYFLEIKTDNGATAAKLIKK